ncbi:MAG: hypothetical protein H0X37_03900 [Herpetosiphonaceae bacterium]|nr:hypothetical protein [Herpetosiphonaceae bacterium]
MREMLEIPAPSLQTPGIKGAFQTRLRAARWLWVSLFSWAITRLGIAIVAYIATPLIIDPKGRPYFRPGNTLLDAFGGRWDDGFYLEIVKRGYHYKDMPLPSVAFFPLLPLLMRAGQFVVGDAMVGGLIVTNLALLGATMLFYRLVGDEWGSRVADRGVWYLLIFPTSFFGSALYTESLFLLGAIGALYAARKGRWTWAALLGIVTTSSRLVGLVVAPVLLIEWWMQHRQHPNTGGPPVVALAAPLAVPLGTAAYMFYLQRTFGDALAFAHASAAWGRKPGSPLVMVRQLLERPSEGWIAALLRTHIQLDHSIDALFVLLFLILGCVLLRQRRWSEAVFVLLGAVLSLSSGLWASQRRYMWVLFPVFILLARWGERQWVDRLITTLSLLGLGLFTTLFVNWYWVA